jgi:hypothetical protein
MSRLTSTIVGALVCAVAPLSAGCASQTESSCGADASWTAHPEHGTLSATEQQLAARIAHKEVNGLLRSTPGDPHAWQCDIDSVIAAKLPRGAAERSGLINRGACSGGQVILVRVVGVFTHMGFDGGPGISGTRVPGGGAVVNIAVDPNRQRKCWDSGSPYELPPLHDPTVIYRK